MNSTFLQNVGIQNIYKYFTEYTAFIMCWELQRATSYFFSSSDNLHLKYVFGHMIKSEIVSKYSKNSETMILIQS